MKSPATKPQIGSLMNVLLTLLVSLITGNSKKIADVDFDAVQRIIDDNKEAYKQGGLLDRVIECINRNFHVEASAALAVVGTFLNKIKCYMGDNFEKLIAIPTQFDIVTEQPAQPLSSLVLSKIMDDAELTAETKNRPTGIATFLYMAWLIVSGQLEVFKQKFGQEIKQDGTWYVMHVQLADRVVAVVFNWRGDRFDWSANPLRNGRRWGAGGIFLFFATPAETSAS